MRIMGVWDQSDVPNESNVGQMMSVEQFRLWWVHAAEVALLMGLRSHTEIKMI